MRNAAKVDPRIDSIDMRLGYARGLACFNEFVNGLSNFPLVYMCSGTTKGACNFPREHGYDLPYGAVWLTHGAQRFELDMTDRSPFTSQKW